MATADELLSTLDTDKTLIIDKDLRIITIPSSVKNLGVESDDDVLRLKFSMPRMYGDVDLSDFSIYINYMNAKNTGDVYVVDDKTIADDTITFSWLVGRVALAYKGSVRFIICMKLYDSAMEKVIKEYNTTIASLPVLEGLETSEAAIEQNPDILTYINKLIDMKVDVITPTIGDNGNWYLGDTDTNKPSRGEKGDTGARGEKGADGAQGPQGKTGPQGPRGEKGDKGNTGAQGPKGEKGDTGAQGPKGDKGDTGAQGEKGADGATGATGADGKSAYSYAVDGGYTRTEKEFAEKLAQEQLTGTTSELTPAQVYDAVSSGIPVKVQYTDSTYGLLSFTAFNVAESLNVIVSQTIVYYNSMYILAELYGNKSNNTWGTAFTTLAQKTDIPSALPNPYPLTFTGAVSETYDGSSAKTIEIPIGADGITPTIGDNGNWFLGTTDTGKPSRGEKGDTGDVGPKGDTGATGAAGQSAYAAAQAGGYTDTEANFYADLAAMQGLAAELAAI